MSFRRHVWCKECCAAYDRERYASADGKERQRKADNRRKIIESNRQVINRIKTERGCVDCGYAENADALQFDHVRGQKDFNVSEGVMKSLGLTRILEEVEKCEVRCGNCHLIITAQRRRARGSR